MSKTIGHFANDIKTELLLTGEWRLVGVKCNYENIEDDSLLGLVFKNKRTEQEKVLFFVGNMSNYTIKTLAPEENTVKIIEI